MSKIIAVFGSTGNQGGSVLRALSSTGKYQLRAVTRNANSDKAKALTKLPNVTAVEADLDNQESVDKVLQGCYGAFLVTDFSAHFVKDKEINQGKSFIDLAIKNNLKHVVFSGLENVENTLKKPCLHFDYKAVIEEYGLKQADKLAFTSVRMPMFYQEFAGSSLYKASENEYYFIIPMDSDKMLYGMSVEEIGGVVSTVFANPEKHKSQIIGMAGDYMKVSEYAEVMSRILAPAKVVHPGKETVSEQYKTFKFPGVEDIINMFDYYNLETMRRDLVLTKELNPSVSTFSQWLEKNKAKVLDAKK